MSIHADTAFDALKAGRALLHPTDTLPGLAFDPESEVGLDVVRKLKGRDEGKAFLALAPTVDSALALFEPLPSQWQRVLPKLWPGGLSVVWRASNAAPRALVSVRGEIGVRVPKLPPEAAWFGELLTRFGRPLPTTSVNASGEPAIASWDAAVLFLSGASTRVHVPRVSVAPRYETSLASTVIRIKDSGEYEILRRGAVSAATIDGVLKARDS